MKSYWVSYKIINFIWLWQILLTLSYANKAFSYDFFDWNTSVAGYELAVMDAEEEEKPLIIYFYLKSDEWSEKMNENYLAASVVEEYIMDIPKAAINPSDGTEEAGILEKMGIERCPAFLISIPSFKSKPLRIHPFSEDHTMTVDEFLGRLKDYIVQQYSGKGYEYFKKKDYESSLAYFEKSLTYDPDRSYSYHAIGIIYNMIAIEKNDPEILKKAEESYLKALEIDPDNKETKEEIKKVKENMKKFGIK